MSAAGANTDVPHETGCVHLFEVGNLGIATAVAVRAEAGHSEVGISLQSPTEAAIKPME